MVSDQKIQEKIRWTPHSAQREILLALDKREIVIDAGRRFGKSALCAYIALKVLLEPDKRVWIVSPSYDLSLKVFNYLARWFLMVAPSQAKGVGYRPTPRIKTAQSSFVECKSTDSPTSLLGDELDLIIVDEASRIPPRIWEAYLFPALSSRKGKVIFISTPNGKNWFYNLWVRIKETGGSFTFPSNANPNLTEEEWKRAKELLPQDVFSQEYEAKFLDDAASVFRGLKDIVSESCLADVKSGHNYICGVDLGKHKDFTVVTVIDLADNHVVHVDRFNQLDWNLQKARIISVAERYNHARIIIDSTGLGDPIADDLRLAGMVVDDFKYSSKSKQQLIQKLAIFIEQKDVVIPNNETLLDELQSFGYNISESGIMSYSSPQGGHDDMVNSLGLAVWGLFGRPQGRTALQNNLAKPSKTQSFI